MTWPPLIPPPASDGGPGAREVVAARLRVDLRGPAEFAHPDDQRRVEQPAPRRSSIKAAQAGSSTWLSFLTVSKFC